MIPPAVSLARQDLFQHLRASMACHTNVVIPRHVQLRNQRILRLSGQKSRCQVTQYGSLIFAHGDTGRTRTRMADDRPLVRLPAP